MPIHDWTKVPAGLFHHFHQSWCIRIADALNSGRLPDGTAALVEQRSGPYESDVLAVEAKLAKLQESGGVATAEAPVTRMIRKSDRDFYAERGSRVVIKHHLGKLLAVIEIVSPGNKDRKSALHEFVEKTVEFLRSGVHVLVIDLFPPSPRDPYGLHKLIWDEFEEEEDFQFPTGKDRLLVSYVTGLPKTAYIDPVGLGDPLTAMPLFLSKRIHVPVPLEETYAATWDAAPAMMRDAVTSGRMPTADE